ncbi:MAG: ATP-binding protein [Candidatus Saganbacteria bacterium]|nr:ATP-binding protein [Candidatus Saganbacteria bacterium]
MDTKEKLKKILTEWHEFKLPKIYQRDFTPSLLEGNEILSIVGARRTGKTYLCYQIIEELKKTCPADNVIYINFEDERLSPLRGDELTLLWEVYLEIFAPDLDKKVYIFADEIHNADNWSKWARRITEQNKNIKLIVTGSSSKLLSREIATELRGRTLGFTVYPFSFQEYLKAQNVYPAPNELKRLFYGNKRILLKKQFNAYLKNGGFPATLRSSNSTELLKEYYRVMFYRDLIERYKIKNIKLFEDYLTLVIDQTASLFSISSTAKKLEDFGHSFSKNTLSNFSRYAQEIFLIFEVKKYAYKIKEQLRSPKKIYAIDHGLIKAVRFSFAQDTGRFLENIAFIALERKGYAVYYHKEGKECDFIVSDNHKIIRAFQVTKSLSDAKTKKREIDGLIEAMEKYNLKEGTILTEDEKDSFKFGNKTINVLPLWHWLLTT